jgi:hypothetical protein
MNSDDADQKKLTRRAFFTGAAVGTVGGLVAGGAGAALAASKSEPQWSKEADVVVVGGGGSGLSAAMSAVENGAKVIVLESAVVLGGAGSLCVGSVTTPLSSLQKNAGITDSVEDYMEDILKLAGPNASRMDKTLLRLLAENGGASIDWLIDHGVNIQGVFEYPDHRVKRLHMLYPKSAEWPKVFRPILEQKGAEILTATKGLELYRNANSRVVGIKVIDQQTGRTMNIKARRAVILTAGNLEANRALMERVTTPEIAALPVAVPTNDGSGLIMAAALGAGMTLLDNGAVAEVRGGPPGPAVVSIGKQHWMPYGIVDAGAIIVNKDGKRFTNEEIHGPSLCVTLGKQPFKTCHLVFDQRVAAIFNKWPMVVCSLPGIGDVSKLGGWALVDDMVARHAIKKADTIEALAAEVDVDPAGLKAEIEKWNAHCSQGSDPDFNRKTFGHKDANTLGAGIKSPPFYCHSPLRTWVTPGETSLIINTSFQVLDVFGNVIPGLYAAGNMGHNTLLFTGHGMHMAWAFTSGRLSGKIAAAETA